MITEFSGIVITSITFSSTSVSVLMIVDLTSTFISFSTGRIAIFSTDWIVPLSTYCCIASTTFSAWTGVIVTVEPAASKALLIEVSTAALEGTFSSGAFSGAASWAFSITFSSKAISTLPGTNTSFSSSSGTIVSLFFTKVTSIVLLDTSFALTGAMNAV